MVFQLPEMSVKSGSQGTAEQRKRDLNIGKKIGDRNTFVKSSCLQRQI